MDRDLRQFVFLVVLGLCLGPVVVAEEPLLRITAPVDRSLIHGGQTINVVVSADASVKDIKVLTESPLPNVKPTSTSGQFGLVLPMNVPPGWYEIRAVGSTGTGPIVAVVTVDVEREDTPTSLVLSPDSWSFRSPEGRLRIDVAGIFPGSGALSLSRSTLTSYISNDPSVVTVSSDGFVRAIGPGQTTILIRYESLSVTLPITVGKPK